MRTHLSGVYEHHLVQQRWHRRPTRGAASARHPRRARRARTYEEHTLQPCRGRACRTDAATHTAEEEGRTALADAHAGGLCHRGRAARLVRGDEPADGLLRFVRESGTDDANTRTKNANTGTKNANKRMNNANKRMNDAKKRMNDANKRMNDANKGARHRKQAH